MDLEIDVTKFTVGQMREIVAQEKHTKKGIVCPCCNRLAKVYKRSINQGVLPFLKGLYILDEKDRVQGHVGTFFKAGKNGDALLKTAGGDYSKLEWWGLIEQEKTQRRDGSWRSGYWRITLAGKHFLEGRTLVPKHIYEYDGKPIHPQPQVDVIAIGNLDPEFNLQKIL